MFSKFQICNNDNQNQRDQICKQSMSAFGENIVNYYFTSERHILEHCSHQGISQKIIKPLLVLHSLRFLERLLEIQCLELSEFTVIIIPY